jgi:hypothetical protein
MGVRALLRTVLRLWPQKVRTRLTLIYATLFFAAGAALLTLTYGLVASNLPTQPSAAVARVSSQELNALSRECYPLAAQVDGGVDSHDAEWRKQPQDRRVNGEIVPGRDP